MKTIYKYPILLIDFQTLLLPLGAEVINIINKLDGIYLYAIVDSNEKTMCSISIRIYPTGHSTIHDDYEYFTTIVLDDIFVWHIFIKIDEDN